MLSVTVPPVSATIPSHISVACERPCRLSIRLVADDSAAVRVLTSGRRQLLLAHSESAILDASAQRSVRLSPTAAARRRFGGASGRLTATLMVTARDDLGVQGTSTTRIAIGPPRPWRVVIGRSRGGRPIIAHVPDADAGLLVVAGIHGDEGAGARLVAEATRRAGGGLRAAVVTVANPDGYARRTRHNRRNVDLNRNFPSRDWGAASAVAPGPAPASEPETRALVRLIRMLRPANLVTVHTPLGLVEDPARGVLARRLSRTSGLPLVRSVGYPTPGSLGTWAPERGIPEVTLELPPGPADARTQKAMDDLLAQPAAAAAGSGRSGR